MQTKNRNETAVVAVGGPGAAQQQNAPIEYIIQTIIDKLKLDHKTVARIYEHMHDDRFTMAIEGEEIFMTVGPVECDSEGYADIALTPAEAIALALRLIKHAIELTTV